MRNGNGNGKANGLDAVRRNGGTNGNGSVGDSCTCRLRRGDGSEWLVTELRMCPGGAIVSARLLESDRFGGGNASLEQEPLRSGDRLEWIDAHGSVTWAMKTPVSGQSA